MLQTKRKSILVLDDDPDIGNIFKLGLQRKFDSDVFAFTNPFLALEHFKINSDKYGLVISDVRMPIMNGYEFIAKVKQINPDVKICLMSAFEINELELDLLKSIRIDEFLQKPLSIGKLTEVIGGMLENTINTQ
jgi:DNA-binding NtrC family response regulator